jgi:3-oxoacyl-[acyl-carrier-protein] synthase III
MKIGIRAIAAHLPQASLENADLVAQHGFDPEFLDQKLGIHSRHRAAADEHVSDMAAAAGRAVLAKAGVDPADIQFLAVVTQTPDYCLPQVSALVQHALGLPTSVAALDLGLGCSGFVYGLATATAFMQTHGLTRGLLITAEAYGKIMDPADRGTAPLFGDGACATLLTDEPLFTPGSFVFGTDGGRFDALIARGSGTRKDGDGRLFMDGRAIFNFMMQEIPPSVARCLAANGLTMADVDLCVPHQASLYMLTMLARRLGVPEGRLVTDMEDVGNTVSSSIPLALMRRVLPLDPRPAHILITGFGVGLSWCSTILFATENT